MNPLIELLQRSEGTVFVNEDGVHSEFKLLPPLSDQELATVSYNVPYPIPADILDALKFARGFDGTWLGEVSFAGQPEAFGLDWIFPHVLELARDELGNSWVMDVTEDSVSWGPICLPRRSRYCLSD